MSSFRASLIIVLVLLTCQSSAFLSRPNLKSFTSIPSRRFFMSESDEPLDKLNVNPNNEKRDTFGGAGYWNGMITEPIENKVKVDGKERDNLGPNIKFGAMWAAGIFGLFGLFVYANKDLAPPPFISNEAIQVIKTIDTVDTPLPDKPSVVQIIDYNDLVIPNPNLNLTPNPNLQQ
jgi:hypothetical protein